MEKRRTDGPATKTDPDGNGESGLTEAESCFNDWPSTRPHVHLGIHQRHEQYIVEREPWTLAKDPANKARLETIIYNLLEACG